MENMKEWKNVLSDTGESMDRQQMIDKIYEVVWYNEYIFKSTDSDCWSLYIVMIWDVLDYIENNKINSKAPLYTNSQRQWDIELINKIRFEKRKPIEEQDIHCVKYVYDIVSEK